MEERKYVTKEGKEGVEYKAEAGDKVVSRFAYVRTTQTGNFDKHSLGVKYNDTEIYVTLTGGQTKGLKKFGDLTGKTIVFYNYENDFGQQVGAKVEE